MPPKLNNTQGVTAAAVDAALPRTFFVMRGHICAAFGLTSEDMTVLVRDGTFVAKYLRAGGRAKFIRSQVLAVARKWEGQA